MKPVAFSLIALAAVADALAGEVSKTAYEPDQFFRVQLLPILQTRCYECHSRDHEAEGELFLDSKIGWQTGGENGPAVKPGDLKNNPLIQAVRHLDSDSAMPPKKKLPPIEIALQEKWVRPRRGSSFGPRHPRPDLRSCQDPRRPGSRASHLHDASAIPPGTAWPQRSGRRKTPAPLRRADQTRLPSAPWHRAAPLPASHPSPAWNGPV
jgi:hypothetical protein